MAEKDLARIRQELLPDHPELGRTKWTWELLKAAEQSVEAHLDDCGECQKALEDTPPQDGLSYYCPVGESLSTAASNISLEYSWQPDFPKPDDPRWGRR